MNHTHVYGRYNGIACKTKEEFVYRKREKDLGYYGPITDDKALMDFCEKVSGHWQNAGWPRDWPFVFISDYVCSEPKASLTNEEFNRIKELQKIALAGHKAKEDAREWKLVDKCCYADNSVEETWKDKDGARKVVMTVGPHGDACY